jgi:CDP-diacylglycerol--glycerol-3-phosphate 3-phosphatidyltransferase
MKSYQDRIVTIPNILSFYRLLAAPVIIGFALTQHRDLFVVFLCVSLVTDILDGLIARTFSMQSKIGSRLDSIADDCTFVAAFVGIFQFEYESIRPHIIILYVFIAALILTTIIPIIKFKKTPAYHLYSFRISGYILGFFIFYLFIVGFNVYFYYMAIIIAILASLEVIAVTLVVKEPVTNVKGLYWVLRNRND